MTDAPARMRSAYHLAMRNARAEVRNRIRAAQHANCHPDARDYLLRRIFDAHRHYVHFRRMYLGRA